MNTIDILFFLVSGFTSIYHSCFKFSDESDNIHAKAKGKVIKSGSM